jgi:hypothetical protein
MSTKTTTPPTNEKIIAYFEQKIGFKEFAQQIRRANYIISDVMMQPEIEEKITKSDWARDCFFFLNEFAEILDPLLEKNMYETDI